MTGVIKMIDGVIIKSLKTYADERGYFREIIRVTDDFFAEGFGQLSHSLVHAGIAKAWHIHQHQTDWIYVATGALKLVLHDGRLDSPSQGQTQEVLLGNSYESQVVKVPAGVAHGYKVVDGPAHVFYVTSNTYNPDDEGRIPHDDPDIGYDWVSGPRIT
jgi:dTDP-4-dehydrorhamnose 3,5-epimerase